MKNYFCILPISRIISKFHIRYFFFAIYKIAVKLRLAAFRQPVLNKAQSRASLPANDVSVRGTSLSRFGRTINFNDEPDDDSPARKKGFAERKEGRNCSLN